MSDWNEVTVLRKPRSSVSQNSKQAVNIARRQGAPVETVEKIGAASNKHATPTVNTYKLDQETDNLKHKKIPMELAKYISQARLSKGLSQKDLATKICEKVQVVNDYEAGRGIPNNTIIFKIERALGVKVRGKDRGQPIVNKTDKK